MPEHPTYSQIAQFEAKLTDKAKGIYGICLFLDHIILPGFQITIIL